MNTQRRNRKNLEKITQLSAWIMIILAGLLFVYIWRMRNHREEAIMSNPEAFESAGYVIDDYIAPDYSDTSAELQGVPEEIILEDGARVDSVPLS